MALTNTFYDGTSGDELAIDTSIVEAQAAQAAAEAAQTAAEAAQAAAEAAQTAAETAQTNAETAETNAETAETNAETAETNAETAQAAAEAAQTAAETAETNAETAESNADDSASDAQKLAINAEDSQFTLSDGTTTGYSALHHKEKALDAQTAAETAKTAAQTAQTAAETAQTAAENAQTQTESIFDQFGDQYLGSKTSDPTTDNDGDPLNSGDIYWNSTSNTLRFYNGTNWVAPETIATTAATNASNSATAAATSATNAATSESNASTSESNASTSETNAATSATNAATSATNAASSATTATTQATTATTQATAAAASATSAATYAANAASSYDQFDDRYLGSKTSDPSVDNDGNALVIGALYFNSTDGEMRVYTSSGWVAASSSLAVTFNKYYFTATSNQTAFTGTDDEGETFTCSPDYVIVTLNGITLDAVDDYTATSSTITLTTGATAGDELNVYAFAPFTIADVYTQAQSDSYFVAKAGSTMTGALTLSGAPTSSLHAATKDYVDTQVAATNELVEDTSPQLGANLDLNSNNITGTGNIDITGTITSSGNIDGNLVGNISYYAKASSAIAKGDVVMFNGAQGDHLLVVKADMSASGFKPEWVMGVSESALSTGDFGNIVSFGQITNLNTSTYTDGDFLYLSPSTAGAFTTTEPTPTDHIILIAAVTNAANNVSIQVRLSHKPDTDEVPEGSTNLYYTNTRVGTYLSSNGYDTAVNIKADLVDSAPATLDTLNELAAALGDDANFSTTVTTSIATKLAKASNLSDLTNVATARTNLGLGTAATTASTDYATAAQGLLANSAVQNLSDLNVTATSTEINYSSGVTSNIQTQLDSKGSTGDALAFSIALG